MQENIDKDYELKLQQVKDEADRKLMAYENEHR